jgi:serine/threonine-protein kinase
VLATVAAVLAVVAGVVWMRFKGSESLTPARIALAVLPFEHVGDSTTAYFADGLTSEIRTRLGSLPELQVLASGSSNQYRTINASLVEVGRELGVRYLLMGKVRSSVDSAGVRQLKVSPELVDTRTGGGTSAWTSSYQVTPTDVFAVQGEIAQRVAEAMGVALGASRKAELATLPTRNMAAYDAFLRAEAISQQRSVRDPATLRRAFEAYREAARLDSTFLLAVARGVNVGSTLWFNRPPDAALADTLRAMVQQAMALDPRSPATLSALGDFQLLVRQDQEQALSALAAGLRASPDDPALLNSAATADRVVGRWADSRARLERLIVLDPRSPVAWNNLGRTLLWTREYSAARAAFERALALAPANLGVRQHLTMHWLAQGRLDSARAVIRGAPATVTREALVAFFGTYWDLAWVLEPADLRLLTSLRPDRFDGDLGNWGLVLGQAYHALGDTVRARIYADSGAAAILARRDKAPDDWQQRMLRGLALAYAGHHDEAIAEGERAVAMKPLARDATFGAYALFTLARIYGFVGEPQKARAAVDRVLAVPMFVTKEWMTLDPAFRGVR